MRYRSTWAILLTTSVFLLCAYRFQPQRLMYVGAMADASTDCDGDTDATASLTCLNTGDISVPAFAQVTVRWFHENSAGTAVHLQCDEKDTGTAENNVAAPNKWALGSTCAGNTCVPMDLTWAVTGNTAHTAHFGADADTIRCRAWVTGGGASDKLQLTVRIASVVGDQ